MVLVTFCQQVVVTYHIVAIESWCGSILDCVLETDSSLHPNMEILVFDLNSYLSGLIMAWCKAVSVEDQNPWEEFFNVKVNELDCEHCLCL